MHELSLMMGIIRTIEDFAKKNELTKIDAIVLEVGELSSVIPRYLEACYPAAVKDTILQDARLEIELIHAEMRCADCAQTFPLVDDTLSTQCPYCGGTEATLSGGADFRIKEIYAL